MMGVPIENANLKSICKLTVILKIFSVEVGQTPMMEDTLLDSTGKLCSLVYKGFSQNKFARTEDNKEFLESLAPAPCYVRAGHEAPASGRKGPPHARRASAASRPLLRQVRAELVVHCGERARARARAPSQNRNPPTESKGSERERA